MVDYFIERFGEIAKEYDGKYEFTEEVVGGIGGSSLPLSKHYITVPNGETEIQFYIEFGGTAIANVVTSVNNFNKFRIFEFDKKHAFWLLFSKNKRSLRVVSKSESVKISIEKLLDETGLEEIARNTIFEPLIYFKQGEESASIEMAFSMAFVDKEKSIGPIILFLRRLTSYISN